MAGLARGWEIQRRMAWIGGLLKIGQVTGRTFRGKPLELSFRCPFVAGFAFYCGVGSD